MENSEDLKPCPFCRGAGLVRIAPDVNGLKKCPHCGGKAEIKRGEIFLYNGNRYDPMNWNGWIVSCKNCKHTEEGVEKSEAISAWNRSANSEIPNNCEAPRKLTYAELEKMVKPLEWHKGVSGWVSHVSHKVFVIEQTGENEFCVNKVGYFNSLEEAKAIAWDWIVDLIAAALDIERSK